MYAFLFIYLSLKKEKVPCHKQYTAKTYREKILISGEIVNKYFIFNITSDYPYILITILNARDFSGFFLFTWNDRERSTVWIDCYRGNNVIVAPGLREGDDAGSM